MSTVAAAADGVSLRELLPEAEFRGANDIVALGCTTRAHEVRPGDIFVVLPDAVHYSRELLPVAIERGCLAVVLEPPFRDLPVPQCLVNDAQEAFGRICHALAGNPSRHLKLVGVTGAAGKTTTCWLIAAVLSAAGYKTGWMGTLGCFDGQVAVAADDWPPQADRLAGLLARMVLNRCTHAVIETPLGAIATSQISGVQCHTVCITNSADEDAEVHRDHRNAAARRIFRHLAPEGLAILNADDSATAELLRHFDGPALTVAIREPAEITAVLLEQHRSEQTFLLMAGNEAAPVRTQMIGVHHVYNCLTAAAVGLAYGIDLVTIARGLESVRQLPGRLERIECGQPFSVFVDCAPTPQALRAALQTLRRVCQGRLICLLGTDSDDRRCLRPRLGAAADEFADVLILTSSTQGEDDPQVDVGQTLLGVSRRDRTVVIIDRRAAIHWALAQARPGDCVLLAGGAHGPRRVTHGQIASFDDRAVVRQWLYTVQPYCLCNTGPWG